MNIFMRSIACAAGLLLCSVGQVLAELPHIKEELVITGATSPSIPMVSLHLSSIEDDVAKMQEQDSVSIDAGTSLEFKHGSFHLMLMGLKENLTPGTTIDITLQTNTGELPIQFPVITPDEASSMMSHEHHSSKNVKKHSHNNSEEMTEAMDTDTMPKTMGSN